MAQVVAPSAAEPQGTADAAPAETVQDRGFTVTRRRPMHPGRFMDFARKWFGALAHEAQYTGSSAMSRAETSAAASAVSAGSPQPAQGRTGWIGGFCKRRQPPAPIAAVGETTSKEVRDALLSQPVDVPADGSQLIHSAKGTIWFANSDDRRAKWVFEAPFCVAPSDRHKLRLGTPWELGELGQGEAGERQTSLSFVLRHSSDDMEEIADEALAAVETRLRQDLQACFLTRVEAAVLDDGEPLADMAEWEAVRSNDTEMVSFASNFLPALRFMEVIVRFISSIPGGTRLAAVGEAVSDRTQRALGHVPEQHGHSDDEHEASEASAVS